MSFNSLFSFNILQQGPMASRLGRLATPHGLVETPAFIFCATRAAMKSVTVTQLKACHTQIILSNTYHLMLQPGSEVVRHFGGLQKFTGWHGPMLTDSGGFQIFSLGHGSVADEIKGRRRSINNNTLLNITEKGAVFRSYVNGLQYALTPEASIRIQQDLGADLIVVLDECTPFHVDKAYTEASMERSHRWALRSLATHQALDNGSQKLYGIIQGGVYPDLRQRSCDFVNSHPFFGHAIGGSLGADKMQMAEVVAFTMSHLSRERPVHLLGIGGIQDIFSGVLQGIDTFDCVHPTRVARHGGALVKPWNRLERDLRREHLNLKNSQYRLNDYPIEPDCACLTCQQYSKGYLHHLFKTEALLAFTLVTEHNVYFMNDLMQRIRVAIASGKLMELLNIWNMNDVSKHSKNKSEKIEENA